MNEQLLGLMKNSRDDREKFFLQGAKLCYTAKSTLQPVNHLDEERLENLKLRLSELTDEVEYVNPLDGKLTTRSKIFAELEVLDALFCTYDMTALFGESIPEGLADDIKTVLHRLHYSETGIISWEGLRRILDEPVGQTAHRSVEIFSLKIADSKYPNHLLHELFIMLLYTNRLRKIIPNFQLAYASLNLQKPKVELEECVGICPCNTDQSADYLLLEKLKGVTMTEALKTCSLQDFLSWIIQLSLALEMGVVHFGFTHNNLQTDNVIIRKLDAPTSIRYFHRNQLYLLKTSTLAVMTNFELSHVKHRYDGVVNPNDEARSSFVVNQSEHFGPVGYSHLGIYHNETRPFYDLYKVVMWSLKILEKHNNHGEDDNVFLQARKVSKFFGFVYERELKKALETEVKLGFIYSVTISDVERSRSIGDFINHLLGEFPRYSHFRRADGSIFNPIDHRTGYLDCSNFCLLDGHSKLINEGRVTKLERLKFLGAQGILERYYGLRKRAEELARFVGLACAVDLQVKRNGGDKEMEAKRQAECKRFTEEALEAEKEFKDFKQLVDDGKLDVWQLTLGEIEQLRRKIDELIRLNRLEVQAYRDQLSLIEGAESNVFAKELLCQNQETIKGKIVTLVGWLSILNSFNLEFELGQAMPAISISPIEPI